MPTDKRQREQIVPGDDPKLKRQRRKDNRRIRVGQVVGNVHGDPSVEAFSIQYGEAGAADSKRGSAPCPGNRMLDLAALVPQRRDQRKATEDACTNKEERRAKAEAYHPFEPWQGLWSGPQRCSCHSAASDKTDRAAPTRYTDPVT